MVFLEQVIIICGQYEGFDERIRTLADEEISIGDYVLSGGEIPAVSIINGLTRLLPGTLGDPKSLLNESHNTNLLEYPQYTRPPTYKGMKVPSVLLSGNHKEIDSWRRDQMLKRTIERRRTFFYLEIRLKILIKVVKNSLSSNFHCLSIMDN